MPGYSVGLRIKRSRAASIVVIGLLVLMMAPLLLLREYGDNLGSTYGHAKTISQALMGLLMLMFPFFRRPQIGSGGGLLSLWTLFIAFAFLSMVWSIDPARTFLFSATFALLIWIGYGLFLEEFTIVRSAFRSMSVLILAFFALAAVLLPLHGGRGFGAISPTIPAAFGFLAIFGQYISIKRSKYFLPIVLISTYLVFFAQARTVLVALVVFFFARYVMMPIMIRLRSVSAFLLFSTLAAIVSMIAIMLFMKMLMGTVDNVAGVHNASRTGDNFSGRLLYWTLGLELFLQSPAIGFGFGTRTAADDVLFGPSFSAHSGAINLMLDLGIVGAALFALIYLTSLASIYRAALKPTNGIDYLSVLSFMIAFVPILAIEPTYISFGNPSSYGFELCLAAALAVRKKAAEQIGLRETNPNVAFSLA